MLTYTVHIHVDLEKERMLEIGVFVVRGEILKSFGHESVPRLIPSYQNTESKDT